MQVTAKFGVEPKKPIHSKRSEQERHRQSHRIHCQQQYAFENSLLGSGEYQNRGQDRTNAGGPAERESESNGKRAPGASATLYFVHPLVGVQRLDLDQAGKMQAE